MTEEIKHMHHTVHHTLYSSIYIIISSCTTITDHRFQFYNDKKSCYSVLDLVIFWHISQQ